MGPWDMGEDKIWRDNPQIIVVGKCITFYNLLDQSILCHVNMIIIVLCRLLYLKLQNNTLLIIGRLYNRYDIPIIAHIL